MQSKRMSLFVLAACVTTAGAYGYKIIRKIPVAGDGFWDYAVADAAARRLYVSSSAQVQVRPGLF